MIDYHDDRCPPPIEAEPDVSIDPPDAVRHRHAMVEALEHRGIITDAAIARAMRKVPRHIFVPNASLQVAYADNVIPVKYAGPEAVSTLSQPTAVATMLHQLDIMQGMRVLEIGSGTGYNAALLSELTGPDGEVVAMDIDSELVDIARSTLRTGGLPRVQVEDGDGFRGYPEKGPFDRIELSVATHVISPHWFDQLADGGLIVVPLYLSGMPYVTPALRKHEIGLVSESIQPCGFIPLQGLGADSASKFRLPVRTDLLFTWEGTDEFPTDLMTQILSNAGEERASRHIPWSAALYLLLMHHSSSYVEMSDHQLQGISLINRNDASLVLLLTTSNRWGQSRVMTYGENTALLDLEATITAWKKDGRPGLANLQLQAIPTESAIDLSPAARRLRKPYFDLVVSYNPPH